MKKYSILLFLTILWIVSACDSPTRPFNDTNVYDPLSPSFKPDISSELQVLADSTGIVTISWPEVIDIAQKVTVEKSLGDSLNYTQIAELSPETLVYRDSSLVVKQDTYYRVSAWLESSNDDVLLERSHAKLDIGEIFDLHIEFLNNDSSLLLSWQSTYPLFTHFDITSENILNEQQEKTIRIEADGINHSFSDPLLDIDFENRVYTVTAVIEHGETEEQISAKGISFNPKTSLQPNAQINVLNETDWELSWEEAPFFATNVEVIRQLNDAEDIIQILPADVTSISDTLFIRQNNQFEERRRYLIRFFTDEQISEQVTIERSIRIRAPIIDRSGSLQDNPTSFNLRWSIPFFPDGNIVKEFIIEKSHSPNNPNFVEIGRVDGEIFEFTVEDVDPNQSETFRVRSITSAPGDPATFIYSRNYSISYSFPTDINVITSMEVSSDNRYLAKVIFSQNTDNSIRIQDLDTRQHVASISIPSHRISDFKISPDDRYIYINAHSEGAIYKADFPSGDNVVKIIQNTGPVYRIDVSKDGSFIVGKGGAIFVRRWSLDTYELEFTYSNPGGVFYPNKNVSISPDGAHIAAAGVRPVIIDAQSGFVVHTLDSGNVNVMDLRFSGDGNYFSFVEITSSGSRAVIYSTENWQRIRSIPNAYRIDSHPEDSTLLIAGENRTYIYDPETLKKVDVISDENGIGFSPNSIHTLTFTSESSAALVNNNAIQIWSRGSGQGWKFVY